LNRLRQQLRDIEVQAESGCSHGHKPKNRRHRSIRWNLIASLVRIDTHDGGVG
jgi:hypothetical protein